MKRFLINTYTVWCGEEQTFAAIAEDALSLESVAEEAAYENFNNYSGTGIDEILEDLFPDVEGDYTDEMVAEAAEVEGDYYGYFIEEWDETRDEHEWSWYDLIYDESNGTEFVINKEYEEI